MALTLFGIACLTGFAAHGGERAAAPSAASAPQADDVVDPPSGVRVELGPRHLLVILDKQMKLSWD